MVGADAVHHERRFVEVVERRVDVDRLAFAAIPNVKPSTDIVLFAGYGIRSRIPFLDRYNIPAPVVGGDQRPHLRFRRGGIGHHHRDREIGADRA